MTGLIVAALTLPGSAAVISAADDAPADTPYILTSTLRAGVKTVLNERVPGGVRIGAVVRLYNTAYRAVSVPAYELRAVTADGVVYTLRPSADNPRLVQPREKTELSYMLHVSRTDAFALDRLAWVSVDEYVYPKKETTVLYMPVSGLEWYGPSTVFTDVWRVKDWSSPFHIPGESADLIFTPVRLAERHTPQGTTAVLVMLARNTGNRTAWVPEFTVTGNTPLGHYPAELAERGPIAIEPGASRYLHFVMKLPAPEGWRSFTISTPESFTDASGAVRYEAGRLQIKPPARSETQTVQSPYKLFDPIRVASTFRPNLAREVDIALAEVTRFEQAGDGFLRAVAKFRLVNRSGVTVALPDFGVEWVTSEGVSYMGERLEARQNMMMPGVGMMIAYVFTLPLSAGEDDKARIALLDGDLNTFQLPIGAVEIPLDAEEGTVDGTAELYPFTVDVRSASLDWVGLNSPEVLSVDIGVARASNVTFDERTLRLKLEAADANGRVLVSRTYALAGANRITSGVQTFEIDDKTRKAASGEIALRLYEVLAASGGDVERLVGTARVKNS